MTFFHFLNCTLATFLPLGVLYKATKLSETPGAWKAFLFGTSFYFTVQMAKLMLVALVISSFVEGQEFVASHEIIKIVLGMMDVVGLWLAYGRLGSFSTPWNRLFGLGLGWTVAHHAAYYLPGYWIYARSLQFTYDSLEQAIASQLSTIILMCLPFLTYFAMKKNNPDPMSPKLAAIGLFLVVAFEGASKFLAAHEGLSFPLLLAAQTSWVLATAGITYLVWNSSKQTKE